MTSSIPLRGRPLAWMVALVLASAGACGGHGSKLVAPKAVPVALVPATLGGTPAAPDFTLTEFADARKEFARAGTRSEVADGRLWEIRKGATLIGSLQISTIKPNIVLTRKTVRAKIVDLVTQGGASTIRVRGIEVVISADAQKTTYLWFGHQFFEYLQVKGNDVQPEAVLRALLVFQKPSGELDATVNHKA